MSSTIIANNIGRFHTANSLNTSTSSSINDNDLNSSVCSSFNNINNTSFVLTNELACDNDDYIDYSRKTNLIVNYLPQNMTQEEIKTLFSSIGPVETCKLIKDKLTGQSLGYAFVNYVNLDDATKAVNELNSMRLQNKTIKVSFARPSSETIKGANLYICGLKADVTQQELEAIFTEFGTIISSKILGDPKTGVSKGVGFVRFDQRIEAEIAIAKLNGKILEGYTEPITVKYANTPTTAKTVVGLPLAPVVMQSTCRGVFQPYRSTTTPSFRYSPMNTYCTDTSALYQQQTMQSANINIALNGTIAGPLPSVSTTPNQNIMVNQSMTSSTSFSGWCIFVYNLGPETDESFLWQLFGPFGAVQSVKIIRDSQTQKCKGFGFITMTNYEEAIVAINVLNGYPLGNRILQVSFKTNNKQYF